MSVPKLRFKEFGGDWKLENLGDSFSLISGYAFPSTSSVDSGAKWLKIADVGIQEMTPNNPSYLPLGYLDKYSQFIVNKNDYVIALTRPILNKKLKIAQVGNLYDGALLNQRVAKIHSKNNNLDFIYSLLQRSKTVEELENSIAGTDPPNLSLNDVKEIKLAFPSKEEQTKIASFLSEVDEKISQLTQKHALLSQYKQGMMQKLFSQQSRFKADDGSEFGEWEYVKIGKYIKEIKENSKIQDEYEVLTSSRKGLVRQGEYFEGSRLADRDNIGFNIIHPNQITYRSRSDDGLFFFNMNKLGITGIISTYYPVFTMDNGDTRFLAEYLNFHKQEYIKYAVGTSQLVLSINELKNMKFHIPCSDEQTKIANFLAAIDQKIEVVVQQIKQVKQWKKGLLQQMFV